MANRTSGYSAELADRRAERARLLAQANVERDRARALRQKGGDMNRAKALEHIAKAKRLESEAYKLRLRKNHTGGPRRKRAKKSGIVGMLARIGGSE